LPAAIFATRFDSLTAISLKEHAKRLVAANASQVAMRSSIAGILPYEKDPGRRIKSNTGATQERRATGDKENVLSQLRYTNCGAGR
jgi:hypothetical protein